MSNEPTNKPFSIEVRNGAGKRMTVTEKGGVLRFPQGDWVIDGSPVFPSHVTIVAEPGEHCLQIDAFGQGDAKATEDSWESSQLAAYQHFKNYYCIGDGDEPYEVVSSASEQAAKPHLPGDKRGR